MLNRSVNHNPLITAVQSGQVGALQAAMAAQPAPTYAEKDQAFLVACECEQLELVKLLFRNGADVDVRDAYGKTAIVNAIEKDNFVLFKFLLEDAHAYANARDGDGKTVLMFASDIDRIEFAKLLLKAKRYSTINLRDNQGKTAIAYAIEKGNVELFNLLVNEKAELDVIDNQSRTLLMLASREGHAVIVSHLISRHLNIHEKDVHGKTALMYAAENGHLSVVNLFLTKGESRDVIDSLRVLLAKFPQSINAQDESGKTMLMCAAESGDLAAVNFLLENGANQQLVDKKGDSALVYAIKNGKHELPQILFEKQAETDTDLNVTNQQGDSLLMNAVINQRVNMARWLLDKGARVDVVNQSGSSLLMLAVISQNVEMVALLLDRGANVHVVDREGDTALLYTAGRSSNRILVLLLEKNANVAVNNRAGLSPLREAVNSSQADNVKTLLHHCQGSRVTIDDIMTSYNLAKQYKNAAVISSFQSYLDCCVGLSLAINCKDLSRVEHYISLGVNVNLLVSREYHYLYHGPNDFNFRITPSRALLIFSSSSCDYGEANQERIIKALIEAGANIKVYGDYGRTPWMLAAKDGNKSLLECMYRHDPDSINWVPSYYTNTIKWNQRLRPIILATHRDRPENAENVRYLLESGATLYQGWEGDISEAMGLKKFVSILVDHINDKIKRAFFDELSDDALSALITNINIKTNYLINQKSARKLVRNEIVVCLKAFRDALKNVSDLEEIQRAERRMKALAALDILRKKPKATKEKSAKQILLEVVGEMGALHAACFASDASKMLFKKLRELACEKPSADKIERVIADCLLKKSTKEEQPDLRRFLVALLNDDERKLLKKNLYDTIEKWSKKYKPEEESVSLEESDQPAPPLMIDVINQRYHEYKNDLLQNGEASLCVLFEILRTSESGRSDVDTGTWKDFVSAIEHGNYLKKYADKPWFFGRRKAPAKPLEEEGMLPMVQFK